MQFWMTIVEHLHNGIGRKAAGDKCIDQGASARAHINIKIIDRMPDQHCIDGAQCTYFIDRPGQPATG